VRARQFGRLLAGFVRAAAGPANFDPHVAAVDPAQLREAILKRGQARLSDRIVDAHGHQHANAPHPIVLSACRDRPKCHRTAEKRDEFPPLHEAAV
jgi:hypothetical protein